MKIGQSLSSTPIGGWPEDEMYKWGSYFGHVPYAVNHLPIEKAYADKIGLVEIVNQLVTSEMEVEPGIIFLGMVLDTLSGRSPLYRLENFFENQDTELLLGKLVDSKSFNDTTVGRLVDKLYEAGTIRIFTELARRSVLLFGLKNTFFLKTLHMSVYN